MTYFNSDDMNALAGELQLALDDSCFCGEAYLSSSAPNVLCAHIKSQILNEPGACGAYPFYSSKQWLIDKVQEFVSSTVYDVMRQWNTTDASYFAATDCLLISPNDDDMCELLVKITFV